MQIPVLSKYVLSLKMSFLLDWYVGMQMFSQCEYIPEYIASEMLALPVL